MKRQLIRLLREDQFTGGGELAVACSPSAEHSGQICRNAQRGVNGVDTRGLQNPSPACQGDLIQTNDSADQGSRTRGSYEKQVRELAVVDRSVSLRNSIPARAHSRRIELRPSAGIQNRGQAI